MNTSENVAKLRLFVKKLVSSRVKDSAGWHRWRREPENEAFMAECLGYVREAGMASITNLVKPFFHPTLPLIGLNYTQVAHNTLHNFENGWTPVLKLCRGIVFDRRGTLVAFPFPKFFNYGEGKTVVPDMPFDATCKHDGHLAIIFEYKGEILATTRGSFESSSGALANEHIGRYRRRWKTKFPKDVTVLCEFIHPETHVHVDYAGREDFIVIGAFSRKTFADFDYAQISDLAATLGIEVTQRWSGQSLDDLIELVKNPVYDNREGFVARFANGERIKFKFKGYIGQMIGEKLTPRYIMMRLTEGSYADKMSDLPGEVQAEARRIAEQLLGVADVAGDKKAKWAYLYGLVPAEEQTPYHKQICRQFYSWLAKQEEVPAA